MQYPQVFLKPREQRRLQAGHLWAYSNEIDSKRSPLKSFTAGQLVNLCGSDGAVLGTAMINPGSLLCLRLLSRHADTLIDEDWFLARLQKARALREDFFSQPYYRAVFGDGDELSGLIVDRFGDYLVVQINAAGMELLKTPLLNALQQLYQPRGILLRNDTGGRAMENLPQHIEVAMGEFPEHIDILENDCHFQISPVSGQKTGWFFDHRPNRAGLIPLARDKKVLDVFAYLGAWSIPLAKAGASSVTAVDISAQAIENLQGNAARNGVAETIQTRCEDAFTAMEKLLAEQQRFDLAVLDPPAFAKRKKDINNARRAYQKANEQALKLLSPGGYLMSASCSFHMSEAELLQAVNKAAARLGVSLQLIRRGAQGVDHPVHAMIAETAYLKALLFRVL